ISLIDNLYHPIEIKYWMKSARCTKMSHVNNSKSRRNYMNTLINTKLPEFKAQVYHKNEFRTVTNKDLEGKWAIFFFYPADFTFVCPTELVDMAEKYEEFQKMGV